MATRPVFLPTPQSESLVEVLSVEFKWHPGFAPSQKGKNREGMHQAAKAAGVDRILEVSSKSDNPIGRSLSAFNLMISIPGHGQASLESAFQGSKVFRYHGSCRDLYDLSAREAKRGARSRDQSDLLAFDFAGTRWNLEPKTGFYDWLYLQALSVLPTENLEKLSEYQAFSDVEFNPAKSFNCQARSCALAVSLLHNEIFWTAVNSEEYYRKHVLGELHPAPTPEDTQFSQQRLV